MSEDRKLRSSLIKLAYDKPELRGALLPILKEARPSYDKYLFEDAEAWFMDTQDSSRYPKIERALLAYYDGGPMDERAAKAIIELYEKARASKPLTREEKKDLAKANLYVMDLEVNGLRVPRGIDTVGKNDSVEEKRKLLDFFYNNAPGNF